MAESHPIEQWRPVLGFEDSYEVSDAGRVRSIARLRAGYQMISGRMLKLQEMRTGYLYVGLSRAPRYKHGYVHIMVLEAFVGKRPAPGYDARHLDGNCQNNRLPNLAWGTKLDNAADMQRHGTTPRMTGEKHGMHRLLTEDIALIFELRRQGMTLEQIGSEVGVSYAHVSNILRGKRWKHVAPG
jgi:hypothetical protein